MVPIWKLWTACHCLFRFLLKDHSDWLLFLIDSHSDFGLFCCLTHCHLLCNGLACYCPVTNFLSLIRSAFSPPFISESTYICLETNYLSLAANMSCFDSTVENHGYFLHSWLKVYKRRGLGVKVAEKFHGKKSLKNCPVLIYVFALTNTACFFLVSNLIWCCYTNFPVAIFLRSQLDSSIVYEHGSC